MTEILNVSRNVSVWVELLVEVRRVCCGEDLCVLQVRQRRLVAMVYRRQVEVRALMKMLRSVPVVVILGGVASAGRGLVDSCVSCLVGVEDLRLVGDGVGVVCDKRFGHVSAF